MTGREAASCHAVASPIERRSPGRPGHPVEQGGYRYIAVALAEHPEGGRRMEDLIAALHRLIVPADVAGAGS